MDLRELDDPAKFVKGEEVELFPAHTRYANDKDGKPTKQVVKDYTKELLERFAQKTADREKRGQPSAMTIGHTVDDQLDARGVIVRRATEEEQPRIVGYWRKWNVKWSARQQRYVLCATPYYRKEDYEEAKTYPRASVEMWRTMEIVDPVALLRRTPDQPVQVNFSAQGERYRPAANDRRYRFSMETGPMEPEAAKAPGAGAGTDPTGAPSATAPSEEELEKFSACAAAKYPHLDKMHAKFQAEQQAATVAPVAPVAPAPVAPVAPPAPTKDKMSARETELATELAAARKTIRKTELEKIRDVERFEIDVDAEMAEFGDESPNKFAAHLAYIRKNARQDPTADKPWVQTADATADKFSADDVTKAEAYQRQHHARLQQYPPDERADRAMRFVKTGKETA